MLHLKEYRETFNIFSLLRSDTNLALSLNYLICCILPSLNLTLNLFYFKTIKQRQKNCTNNSILKCVKSEYLKKTFIN